MNVTPTRDSLAHLSGPPSRAPAPGSEVPARRAICGHATTASERCWRAPTTPGHQKVINGPDVRHASRPTTRHILLSRYRDRALTPIVTPSGAFASPPGGRKRGFPTDRPPDARRHGPSRAPLRRPLHRSSRCGDPHRGHVSWKVRQCSELRAFWCMRGAFETLRYTATFAGQRAGNGPALPVAPMSPAGMWRYANTGYGMSATPSRSVNADLRRRARSDSRSPVSGFLWSPSRQTSHQCSRDAGLGSQSLLKGLETR